MSRRFRDARPLGALAVALALGGGLPALAWGEAAAPAPCSEPPVEGELSRAASELEAAAGALLEAPPGAGGAEGLADALSRARASAIEAAQWADSAGEALSSCFWRLQLGLRGGSSEPGALKVLKGLEVALGAAGDRLKGKPGGKGLASLSLSEKVESIRPRSLGGRSDHPLAHPLYEEALQALKGAEPAYWEAREKLQGLRNDAAEMEFRSGKAEGFEKEVSDRRFDIAQAARDLGARAEEGARQALQGPGRDPRALKASLRAVRKLTGRIQKASTSLAETAPRFRDHAVKFLAAEAGFLREAPLLEKALRFEVQEVPGGHVVKTLAGLLEKAEKTVEASRKAQPGP